MRITLASVLTILGIHAPYTLAADKQNADTEIVVTATRTAQTADEALASVTVLTRKDIESSQARSLPELLQAQSGIHIARNGGPGKTSSIYVRGGNSDHVLVLVDGVRAASSTLGTFPWSQISLNQIERIEIVRGARASLYGSDAITGVIQIFTRKSKRTSAEAGYGSYNTRELTFNTGGGRDWRYSVEAGLLGTDGIPIAVSDTEPHGYDNQHVTLSLGREDEQEGLRFQASHSQGTNENDPSTGNIRYVNRVLSAEYRREVGRNWTSVMRYGNVLDLSQSYSPYIPSTITTQRHTLAWQNDVKVGTGLWSLGMDLRNDHATKDNSGTIDATINNAALFAQLQQHHGKNSWGISARADQHSTFGTHLTGQLSWGYDLNEQTRITAHGGTAFKAPTVNDLYWPYSVDVYGTDTYITQGNTALEPETSVNLELGLKKKFRQVQLGWDLYQYRVKNLIEWVTTLTAPSTYTTTPINRASATIRGMELYASWQKSAWRFKPTLTLLDAIKDDTGQQLDRRPRTSITMQADRNKGPHQLHLEWVAHTERLDRDGTVTLAPYQLINAAYRYRFGRHWQMALRIDNLTNTDYVIASSYSGDYRTPGRSMYINLRYQP